MTEAAPQIQVDDPNREAVFALVKRHLEHSYASSPATSVHAMDVSDLVGEDMTFWTVQVNGEVAGCGALKKHNASLGEVKSMHVAEESRGQGLAKIMLRHIIAQAREIGLAELKLETGTQPAYAPARTMYETHGFKVCEPFADYSVDPYSVYYRLVL